MLIESGVLFTLRNYIAEPLNRQELLQLLQKLQLPPVGIIRRKEPLFVAVHGEANLTDEECIKLLLSYPELMERPIVVNGEKAIVARPPEVVFQLLP